MKNVQIPFAKYSFVAAILLLGSSAIAAPLTWTIDAIVEVENDGNIGTWSGSFDYDADTETFSNWELIADFGGGVNAGTLFLTPAAPTIVNVFSWSNNSHVLQVQTENSAESVFDTFFLFDGPLTNQGGTVNMVANGGVENFSSGSVESYGGVSYYGNVLSGSVSAVPVPAAVWLFGSALAGLGWLRRKQVA